MTSNQTDLSPARAAAARAVIPTEFLDSPQYLDEMLNAELGCDVLVKLECLNPIRSFKARGVATALAEVPAGTTVVCASSGNFGQAVAYIGRSRGLAVRVYVSNAVNPVKRARMEAFGALVIEAGAMTDATASATAAADEPGVHLIVDGVDPRLAEGAATIAEEITRAGEFDAVVVPVGDGSLISGIGLWMREHAPNTRVIGVNPASAPVMHRSRLAGTPTETPATNGFAEGIVVPRAHPEALARVLHLVDDIVLVDDDELRAAMQLIAEHLSLIVEPAGAAGIAAVAGRSIPGARIATLISGANPNPALRAREWEMTL